MRRLIWKEIRELRLWALLLGAASVLAVRMGGGYTFAGPQFVSPWNALPAMAALLVGFRTYSGEIGKSADFLFSRPISWKRVMLAKLVAGALVLLGSAVLATLVFRLTCPQAYYHLCGPIALASGCGIAVLVTGAGYLAGLACSVVLPGALGGLLTFIALYVGCALQFVTMNGQKIDGAGNIAWMLAAFVAMVMIARFGVTLSAAARVRRYVSVLLVSYAVLTPVVLPFAHFGHRALDRNVGPNWTSVSPDGRYTLTTHSYSYGAVLTRRSDRHTVDAPAVIGQSLPNRWTRHDETYWVSGSQLEIVSMDPSGKPRRRSLNVPLNSVALPSPNDRYVLLAWRGEKDRTAALRLDFVDLEGFVNLPVHVAGVRDYWWQSNSKVGYHDMKKVRHVVQVKDAPKAGEVR